MRYLNIVLQGTISEQYQDPWQASTAPSSKPPTRSFNRSSASSHEPRLISTLSRLKEIPTRVEAATSIHNARNNMNLTPHVKGQYQICAFCDSKLTQNCIRLHWILSIPILLIVPSPRGLFNVLPKAIINLLYSAPLSRFFRYKYHPRNPPEDLFFLIIRFITNPTSLQQSFRFFKPPNLSQWPPSRTPLLSRVCIFKTSILHIHSLDMILTSSSSTAGPGGGCVVM